MSNSFTESIHSIKGLSRAISLVENEAEGYMNFMQQLKIPLDIPVIGITGAPGAGKSTLTDALITFYTNQNKKVAALVVDPSSPFTHGSLLGDRVRMSTHFNNPNVFIRSLATRGFLGGISAKTVEITDILKAAGYEVIIIETVGVGQNEVEIAALADTTLLVLVPEGGDEIQNMKAGIMEIADVFVVNKSDRPGAKEFATHITRMLHDKNESDWNPPVIMAIATQAEGVDLIGEAVESHHSTKGNNEKKIVLLAEQAWQLIMSNRMKNLDKAELIQEIDELVRTEEFNLYKFIQSR